MRRDDQRAADAPVGTASPPGCKNVEFCVLLSKHGLSVADRQFGQNANIDAHDAIWNIDVIWLSGLGFARIGSETYPFRSRQTVRWPKDTIHCLWTEATEMETLIIERHGAQHEA